MGIGLIAAGMFFLFDPVVGVSELLPDLIGYILIYCGLRRGSVAFTCFASSRRDFLMLSCIGAVKIVCAVILRFFATAQSSSAAPLVISFLFFCAEIVLLIPAMCRLFDGLLYVGGRCGSEAAFRRSASVKRYTVFFFIIRAFLPMLPDLTGLSSNENLGYVTSVPEFDFARFRNLFAIFSAFLMLIFGIIWIIRISRYLLRIRRETAFISGFDSVFSEKLAEDPYIFIRRALLLGLMLFAVASFFNIDFYIALNDKSSYDDESRLVSKVIYNWGMVNIIPDAISAILYFAGILAVFRFLPRKPLLIPAWAMYFLGCVVSYAAELLFNSEYVMDDIAYISAAAQRYSDVVVANGVKNILYAVFMLALTLSLCRMCAEHTGVRPLHPDHLDNGNLRAVHLKLKKSLWIAFAFSVFSGAISFAACMRMPEARAFWMLDLLFTGVHISFLMYALYHYRNEVRSRYE